MPVNALQKKLLQLIREKIGAHVSLADELADALSISTDSAYRRMRMEKKLSVEELEILCTRYELSLDLAPKLAGQSTCFRRISSDASQFSVFLNTIADDLRFISATPNSRISYYAKDIPMFHYFAVPEIAAFKVFFWRRSVMGLSELEKEKFDLRKAEPSLVALGSRLQEHYCSVPSTEIWSGETLQSLLLQISYYHASGAFAQACDAKLLCDKVAELIDHLEAQVAAGGKFLPGKPVARPAGQFDFYVNEVLLGDNSILVQTDTSRKVYLPHHVVNYFYTDEPVFCEETHNLFQNLMKRSTLISNVGEKDRNRFFAGLRSRLDDLRKEV
jgi:hypothetical protein